MHSFSFDLDSVIGPITIAMGVARRSCQDLSDLTAFLHPKEHSYFSSLKYEHRRESFLLGRASSKLALTKVEALKPEKINIEWGVFNFPVVNCISDKNWQVSISHCRGLGVALAFPETHPMGVDVESLSELGKVSSLKSQFTDEEKALINNVNLDSTKAYLLAWTVKESLSKILKTGLMLDFTYLELKSLKPIDKIWKSEFSLFSQYKCFSMLSDEYIISISLPINTWSVQIEEAKIGHILMQLVDAIE